MVYNKDKNYIILLINTSVTTQFMYYKSIRNIGARLKYGRTVYFQHQ